MATMGPFCKPRVFTRGYDYVRKRLHTFCTQFAHLPESGAFLCMTCTACFPLHKNGTCRGEAPPSAIADRSVTQTPHWGFHCSAAQTRACLWHHASNKEKQGVPRRGTPCFTYRYCLWSLAGCVLFSGAPTVPDTASAPHPPARRKCPPGCDTRRPERPDLPLPGTR